MILLVFLSYTTTRIECLDSVYVKKMIGFGCFMIAVGMFIMLFLDNNFVAIIFIAILLLVGYNLFCCC